MDIVVLVGVLMHTATFEFGLPEDQNLHNLLVCWLLTDPRTNEAWTGMHYAEEWQEGALECFVPGYHQEVRSKLFCRVLEDRKARVMFHNHPDNIWTNSPWSTEAFSNWFSKYLTDHEIEFTKEVR